MNPQLQTFILGLLKLVGGAMAAHGMTKAASFFNAEDTSGVVIALVGFVIAHYSQSPKAIVQKAAESIPQNKVIVGTSDAAPTAPAQVVSPEEGTAIIRKSDIATDSTPIAPIKNDSP